MNAPASKVRKRVREACDPCRRKKGRCPGEKPICSHCARLGQTCSYAGTVRSSSLTDDAQDVTNTSILNHLNVDPGSSIDGSPALDERFEDLDGKISEVLDHVRLLSAQQCVGRAHQVASVDSSTSGTTTVLPTVDALRRAAELYLQFCHCQPLPLLSPKEFASTIFSRDHELRLCIAGLSLRFDPERHQPGQQAVYTQYLHSARSIVMKRILEGKVELSTLQSLCLLAWSDFNDGKQQQSGVYLSLATELARSARLDLHARPEARFAQKDEHSRCLWSMIMLQYLSGSFSAMTIAVDSTQLRQPSSDAVNDLASVNKQDSSDSQEADNDLGVVAYATQMTEVWYMVRQYVNHRGKLDRHPPWSGKSVYSSIMFRQMELESQMPHRHRFQPSGFAEHPITVLSKNRQYWAPWLYLQIIYHAIVCTLNHPLLLSIHLRRFRVNQIPELFLQHTADLITSHTDWIIHLLEIAKEKQFQFSDPFLGQCIAIVATIFLQQSYTDNQEIRLEKQTKFSTCLHFVQDLGHYWSHADEMAVDLQRFESTVSKAYVSSSYTDSPNLAKHVDLTAFWKILDNTLPALAASGTNSMFGSSLRLQLPSKAESELLSTRLLPEPTRVHSLPHGSISNATTPAAANVSASSIAHTANHGTYIDFDTTTDQLADTPFLAQNFFALGQDFVGNADDWFNWSNL